MVLAFTIAAAAQTIPRGTSPKDDLILNFDTSHFSAPARGVFTVYLEAPDLQPADSFVVDVFHGANGQQLLATAYSGKFAWLTINCRIGDALCNALLDGQFSVGVRMAAGSANIGSAYAFAVDSKQVPTPPIFGAPTVNAFAVDSVQGPTPPIFGAPATVTLVEFYNASQDHYFMSSTPAEIADLDTGVHAGWARTGLQFNAYPGPANGANPVCRLYIPPANGDSHFYSASPAECAQVQAAYPAFVFESPDVFFIDVPDPTSGACPGGTIPVYRLWDNRADTNHRYTTSLQIRQQMQAAGWIAEGYGPMQAIMCSPQ